MEPFENIAFTSIAQGNDGPKAAKQEVIRSQHDYAAFFDGTPPNNLNINWGDEMVVAVALGERPTGSSSVEIKKIMLHTVGIMGGRIEIQYVETTSSSGPVDVLTYPYHAIKCRKMDNLYFFTERQE